jgi:hypothetical protein
MPIGQGAATAVIATRHGEAREKVDYERPKFAGRREGPETAVADSTMALRLPLMGLRKAKALSRDAGSVQNAESVQKIQRTKKPDFAIFP